MRDGSTLDVPAMVPLVNAAYLREAWLLPPPRIDEQKLRAELAEPGAHLVIAEVDGAPSGCVRLIVRDGRAYFGLLATAPGLQGQGLASLLVEQAERIAAAQGHTSLHLECAKEVGLPPFYESLGYAAVAEEHCKDEWGATQPWTRVTMEKKLA
jgi:GNAT superfamily N-acetyltransferase